MMQRYSDRVRIVCLLVLLWVAAGCTARTGVAPVSSFERRILPMQANKRGVHLLMTDTFRDWPETVWRSHMVAAREAVGEWGYVTQLIRMDDLDVAKWQRFMDLCAELELTPIIRIATVSNAQIGGWEAPPAAQEAQMLPEDRLATFFSELIWPTETHILIVANEPNHGAEWGGMPDPAAYADFLIRVADALHASDPQAFVLNAGFDQFAPHTNGKPFNGQGSPLMDATSFMDAMISAEPNVFTYIDGWASHPYPVGAFTEPPWDQRFGIDYVNQLEDKSNTFCSLCEPNRGINGYAYELQLLADYGVTDLPVFITETGWLPEVEHADIYLDLALRGNNGRYPDFPEAGWTPWNADDRVVAITPFAFNGDPSRWEKFNWLELSQDGEILGQSDLFNAWAAP